ncbi:unnamed protein product [Spodoptera exigua]|nr:unnamed protein product [Spodoptera exigua]
MLWAEVAVPHCGYPATPAEHQQYRAPSVAVYWLFEARLGQGCASFPITRRIGHPYQNRTPPKRKKPRTSFTRLQIAELEKRFHKQKYLASAERASLAKTLKMTDAQVKTWFQNRRTKWRSKAKVISSNYLHILKVDGHFPEIVFDYRQIELESLHDLTRNVTHDPTWLP